MISWSALGRRPSTTEISAGPRIAVTAAKRPDGHRGQGLTIILLSDEVPGGGLISGYLATTPNDGDVLSFGFAVSTVTELAYHSGEVA